MRALTVTRRGRQWPAMLRAGVLLSVIALSGAAVVYLARQERPTDGAVAVQLDQPAAAGSELRYERLPDPPRTVVHDALGATVATLTDGARTAVLTGPLRTFEEPLATAAKVQTSAWVRLLAQPWRAGEENAPWFRPWLDTVLEDRSPDVLAVATEYLQGAPAQTDGNGVRFRGDASFGPVSATGAGRLERSDFYQYLGVPFTFPDGVTVKPDPTHYGAVDCSGFVRLVYGYRLGYPLLGRNAPGPGLPRRAFAIAEFGPGVLVVPNTRQPSTDYDRLQPGDLVFFEVEGGEEQLDHSGIYLGVDTEGHRRFISSRELVNGPTLGDVGGTSLLDDGGHYSRAFRAARRI